MVLCRREWSRIGVVNQVVLLDRVRLNVEQGIGVPKAVVGIDFPEAKNGLASEGGSFSSPRLRGSNLATESPGHTQGRHGWSVHVVSFWSPMGSITMGVMSMRPCSQNRYPLAPIQMTKVFVVNPHPLELFHEGPQTVIDGGERLGMTLAK